MARTPKRLIEGSQLTTTTATYYTAPPNQSAIIRRVTLVNTTGTARTVNLYLVPDGDSAGAANQIMSARTISANESYSEPDVEGHVLGAGGTIQADADSGSAVTIIASGVEVST